CSPHMLRHSCALRWYAVGRLAYERRFGHLDEDEQRNFRAQFGNTWDRVATMLGHRSPETTRRHYLEPFRTLELELLLHHAQQGAVRPRPGGPVRPAGPAGAALRLLRGFATHLAASGRPPRRPQELVPAHLKSWVMARSDHKGLSSELASLKCFLRRIPGITGEFAACLTERNPPPAKSTVSSYSRDELARILAAARRDVRQA